MNKRQKEIQRANVRRAAEEVVAAYREGHIDVKGSYTGVNLKNPDSKPEQDADDL